MTFSLEEVIAIATLIFGSGILSFFAKNHYSKRQNRRDDFKVITEALYARINALEKNMEEVGRDMDVVKKRNMELIDENREKSNEISKLKKDIEQLLREKHGLQIKNNKLSRERESMIVQINKLNDRVDKLERELLDAKKVKEEFKEIMEEDI